jgi:hypothetical protein
VYSLSSNKLVYQLLGAPVVYLCQRSRLHREWSCKQIQLVKISNFYHSSYYKQILLLKNSFFLPFELL